MKKVLSAALSLAMTASFATGFAVMSSAEEITVDQNHVIPYVQPENIPTIDGKTTSENEWANALKITIDKNTPGPATSDIDGTGDTDETMNSASMEAYVLYSATLDGFETDDDIMWDYIPGDDPIGGLYFRFDVKDTTQAFAAGENGLGLLNLNATDCVQIALNGDPDNAGSGLTGKEWLYTFTGYTAGAPGVGEIPSGYGAWYEYWATGGGNAQTQSGYNIQIKTSMDVDFDPAYPLPEGDLSTDDPGYKEWKKQRDDAFEHITNYRGYTIEAFIEWEAFNMGEGLFVLPIEGQKLGMGLILLNYMYDWEGSGPVDSRQALVWGKSNIGTTHDNWSAVGQPILYQTYQLGPTILDYSIKGKVTTPVEGKASITLSVTIPEYTNLSGIKVHVSFNTEKLTLIEEENDNNYFIGQLIPNQTELTDKTNGKIALTAIALTGNSADVFQSGTANYAKLRFSVAQGVRLQKDDISITVTDAVNFNGETINEKFRTRVIYGALNTNALEDAIEKAKNLSSDEYTTETFSAMMTALKKATAILTDTNAIQRDINAAAESLEQSIADLIRTYRVDGTVSVPCFGTTSVLLTVTTPANANLAGITVRVSFNTEKLTLIPEKNESDYFVDDLIPNQVGLVNINPGKIALQAVALTGNAKDVFPGGTADFAKLNFNIKENTVLEDGDITITVTDAINFNIETIFEKFGTSITYITLDTQALETAIEKANTLDEDLYTTDSFQAVQQALSVAEIVLQKENVTQLEVDSATATLESAINNLIKVTIIGIEITAPTKVYYLMGEEFVADGFTVQNIYQNGKKEFTIGIYTVPNMNTIGVKVIDVTVGNFKGSFTIYVSTKGDINADGKVSLADVISAARTAVSSVQNANSAETIYGDVIGNDGKVTLADVLKLARVSLGVDTID